jgi:hypothetical protein
MTSTHHGNADMERLSNAKRMLKTYTTMRDTGGYTSVESPVVVAHEISNWQLQVDLLSNYMEIV